MGLMRAMSWRSRPFWRMGCGNITKLRGRCIIHRRWGESSLIGSGPFKCEVDLMQPLDANKKPAVQDPPLNHIGLWVDDLKSAVQWLAAQGVRFAPGGIRRGASGYDVCFIHPKGSEEAPIGGEGVLIELVQAPREVIEAFSGPPENQARSNDWGWHVQKPGWIGPL